MAKGEDLDKIRHSLAHLLAAAVTELHPQSLLTLGPAIDNGFYYDFDQLKISEDDLNKIEQKMRELGKSWSKFVEEKITEQEAKKLYKDNPYKLELIDEITAKNEPITIYHSANFFDLCRGGHVSDFAKIDLTGFKLDRIAGAYWRGDEKNKMLTRIYGLAFSSKKELNDYLIIRTESEKRDHRKLGKELGLFTFSELVGAGLPLFTPKGTLMRDLIMTKINQIQARFGYQGVTIPHLAKKDLYETSGHWDKFKDDLFHVRGMSDTEFVIKPMNCPHHTQIYASEPRSYRDLPIRYAETTMVYRDEQAGELMGLSRVRSITQDDGHAFCTLEQVEEEVGNIISVIKEFYTLLGMFEPGKYWVSLSVRDPKTPEKYLGDSADWDQAEKMLEQAAKAEKLDFKRVAGEAAFYGPKLDFMFRDSLGRERQLATAQVDFNMPKRFGLEYVAADGGKQTPVMIHRAIAGSLERFMAIMIEHFGGAFPLWLAPLQVAVLPIATAHSKYTAEVIKKLKQENIRAIILPEDETLGKRIREVKLKKIPYFIVIGDAEKKAKKLTIEDRDGKKQKLTLPSLIKKLKSEIEKK